MPTSPQAEQLPLPGHVPQPVSHSCQLLGAGEAGLSSLKYQQVKAKNGSPPRPRTTPALGAPQGARELQRGACAGTSGGHTNEQTGQSWGTGSRPILHPTSSLIPGLRSGTRPHHDSQATQKGTKNEQKGPSAPTTAPGRTLLRAWPAAWPVCEPGQGHTCHARQQRGHALLLEWHFTGNSQAAPGPSHRSEGKSPPATRLPTCKNK